MKLLQPNGPSLNAIGLDVIIVNWNSGDQLRECLGALASRLVTDFNEEGRVVVVDNGSNDGSLEGISCLPNTVVLRNGSNVGFARACNQGANQGSAPLVLFLNPDTKVELATLSAVRSFMVSSEASDVGVCGVKSENEDGQTWRTCARLPTASMFLVDSLGLDRVFPGLFSSHFMREWDHLSSRDVGHVIGAFYLIRRHVFEQLGGFDERFFVYLEDLDLSWRVSAAGWRIRYLAEPQIFHRGGGVSRQVKAARLFYSTRSKLLFARKHFSVLGFSLVACAAVLIEPGVRLVQAMAAVDRARVLEILRAYGKLYRWLLSGAPSKIGPVA